MSTHNTYIYIMEKYEKLPQHYCQIFLLNNSDLQLKVPLKLKKVSASQSINCYYFIDDYYIKS